MEWLLEKFRSEVEKRYLMSIDAGSMEELAELRGEIQATQGIMGLFSELQSELHDMEDKR
jgi:hypothetical protein